MMVNVKGRNIEITPALKDYVEKRVSKVTRYFSDIKDISALLKVEKNKQIVELTVNAGYVLLRAEEGTKDMYEAIDLVVEKIEKQISKHKTKLTRRFRDSASFKSELVVPSKQEEADNEEFKVVRSKRFPIKPMSIEESIMQMNLLNHSFFVYIDAEDDSMGIVYKRHDGNYGLIQPDIKK